MSEGTPIIIKKKKGHGGHGHHGGSWKVAYADFVTAMMAFFMVMWIMGLSDQTKAQVSGYFNDPAGFMKSMPRSKTVIPIKGAPPKKSDNQDGGKGASGGGGDPAKDGKEMRALAKDINNELSKVFTSDREGQALLQHIETTMTDEGLRIELLESAGQVFFGIGSAEILPKAKVVIDSIGKIILKSGRKVVLEGHTDARKYSGTGYDNWDLSTDRASALRRELSRCGLQEDHFVEVRGFAATRLRDQADPLNPVNRRVTILLPYNQRVDDLKPLNQPEVESSPKDETKIKEASVGVAPKAIDLGTSVGR